MNLRVKKESSSVKGDRRMRLVEDILLRNYSHLGFTFIIHKEISNFAPHFKYEKKNDHLF